MNLWRRFTAIKEQEIENMNAVLIEDGVSQNKRLIKLNSIAIHQRTVLED